MVENLRSTGRLIKLNADIEMLLNPNISFQGDLPNFLHICDIRPRQQHSDC